MTPPAAWLTTVTLLIAMMTYTVAEPGSELVLLMIPLLIIARFYSYKQFATIVPQWLIALATFLAVVYAGFRVLERGPEISVLAEFVAILAVLKSLERWTARDDMQLLIVSIFLVLAAAISSNSLVIGLMLLVFIPMLGYSAMRLQIEGALRFGEPSDGKLNRVFRGKRMGSSPLIGTFTTALVFVIGISVVAFVLLPRGIGGDTLQGLARPIMGPSTGFRNSVQLGRSGLISQDQTIVMEVEVEQVDGRNLGALGVVYHLRGTALTRYEDGRWESELDVSRGNSLNISESQARDRIRFDDNLKLNDIKQTIHLTPNASDGGVLFTLWQPLRINFEHYQDGAARIDNLRRTVRLLDSKRELTEYTVLSADTPRLPTITSFRPPRFEHDPYFLNNTTIRSIATSILEAEGIIAEPGLRPASQTDAAAKAIERWLATSGEFSYTLDIGEPEGDLDPIEWFLTQEKKGHCEYFASAMAALCRSVGINARVITGYVMAEYDSEKERYIVRRSNAHAWVEAEVSRGIWVVFDPTPGLDSLHAPDEAQYRLLRRLLDTIDGFWLTQVVSFDERNQLDMFGLDRQTLSGVNPDVEIINTGKQVLRLVLSSVVAGITGFFVYRWYRRPRQDALNTHKAVLPESALRIRSALLKHWQICGRDRPAWAGLTAHAIDPTEHELASMLSAAAFGPTTWDESCEKRAASLLEKLAVTRSNTDSVREQSLN